MQERTNINKYALIDFMALPQRKDELPSTVSGVSLWHVCDREKLELPCEPALWTVSSIVLLN